jgi:hypothetical protein
VWTWIDGPPPRVDRNLDEYLAQPDISFAEKYGLSGGGLMPTLLLGLGIGLVLGGLAFGYTAVLRHNLRPHSALQKLKRLLRCAFQQQLSGGQ